jgi:hypothetical protein
MSSPDPADRRKRYEINNGANGNNPDEEDDGEYVDVNLNYNHDQPPNGTASHPQDQNEEDSSNEDDKGGKVVFKRTKHHGFMWPLHPQQIGAWCVAAILVISYFLVIIPSNYFIHTAWVVIF